MWKTNPSHQACSTQVFLEPLIACSCVLWRKNPKIVIRLSLSLPEHSSRLYQEQAIFLKDSRRAEVVNYKGAARCAKHKKVAISVQPCVSVQRRRRGAPIAWCISPTGGR